MRLADRHIHQRRQRSQHDIGIPHPVIVAEIHHGQPPQPRAEEAADLVGQQGQAEQGGQVTQAEELAHQARRGGHGGQPGQPETDGEGVEGDVSLRRDQIQGHQHGAGAVHHGQDPLHAVVLAKRTGPQAADDVGQTDQGQGHRRHAGRQTTQVHRPGQVGDEEGDVEAAGKEAGVQTPVATVTQGHAQLLPQPEIGGSGRGVLNLVAQGPRQRNRRQGTGRQAEQGGGPAEAGDQELGEGRKQELPKGPAGIDEAGCKGPPFGRQALGQGADQDRKTAGPGTGGHHHAEGHGKAELAADERRQDQPENQQGRPGEEGSSRAVAVGHGAEDRLGGSPHELPHGQRKTDAGQPQPGGRIEGRDIQAEGLPDAHGDHQHGGCREDHGPVRDRRDRFGGRDGVHRIIHPLTGFLRLASISRKRGPGQSGFTCT